MLATPASELPTGPDWTYEVKWDGYRAIAEKRGRAVRLHSRNQKDLTQNYPSVAHALQTLAVRDAVLDGEIVALDETGRPSFQALQHATRSHAIVYYAFDILELAGEPLTKEPIERRRELLEQTVEGSQVLLSSPLPGTVDDIVRAVAELGLEGIVAKRRKSLYVSGTRSHAWVKVRFARRQEFVLGGYVPIAGTLDAVVVGYYEGKQLRCCGKVRAGFTPALRRTVRQLLQPHETGRCPFVNLPNSRSRHWGEGITTEEMAGITWLKPAIVAEIAFTEWTLEGNLRHAAFVGIRSDKAARRIRRET